MKDENAPDHPFVCIQSAGPIIVQLQVVGGVHPRDDMLYVSMTQLIVAMTINMYRFGEPYGLRAGSVIIDAINALQLIQKDIERSGRLPS